MADKQFNMEKALAMAAGQDINVFYDNRVSEDDKKLLRDALENIFQGSSVILWISGGILKDAWNTALDNMRDEFFATSRRDVLTIFLQRAVFEHRNKWIEKIRNNDNRNQTFALLGVSKTDKDNMINQAEFQRQQGYTVIKQIFEKYDNGFKPTVKPEKIAVKTVIRERENVREERVRERTK